MDIDDEPTTFQDVMETRDLFRFVLPPSHANFHVENEGEASSSTSQRAGAPALPGVPVPALDDDEDTRVEEENKLAGMVVRMEETIVETWKAYFGKNEDDSDAMDVDGEDEPPDKGDLNQKWRPFASELDWQVAMWAVREDVGQNSLNRFLRIPGVGFSIHRHCKSSPFTWLAHRWLKSWG